MDNILTSKETNSDGFLAFIVASKKACSRGDYRQAEKLLKSSLKSAEQQMVTVEYAIVEILKSLLEVYEAQGKEDDAIAMQSRLEQLRGLMEEDYLSSIEPSA